MGRRGSSSRLVPVCGNSRGIAGLPIILIIGVVLGACVLALGISFLENLQSAADRQRATESFDSLVEKFYRVSFGGPGSLESIELELPRSKISVKGRLLSLWIDNQPRRAEFLPLPIWMDGMDEFELESGLYLIKLERVSREMAERENSLHEGDYFLRLSDVTR